MRISDWSSDVCSSDLHGANTGITHRRGDITLLELAKQHVDDDAVGAETLVRHATQFFMRTVPRVAGLERDDLVPAARLDFVSDFDGGERTIVVKGKCGSVRVNLVGRRIIKENNLQKTHSKDRQTPKASTRQR